MRRVALVVVVGLVAACDGWRTDAVGEATPRAEVSPDAGAPQPPPPPPDAPDAGPQASPGPWPTDDVQDWTGAYALGPGVQSVGVDEAYNVWLLHGDSIGVLRPGDARPTWTRGVGQAAQGFGLEALATGSTVICGGEAGRAYVGYSARDLRRTIPGKSHGYIPAPGEPYFTPERWAEYQKGDLDAVRLQPDGSVKLEEHLWRSVGASGGKTPMGIRNTNDFHYDEDRTVLTCQRVMRGAFKGDLYIGTNHGVTRIQGLVYNSHRHAAWYLYDADGDAALQTGESWGLGIGPQGDVLVANQWMVGVLVPSAALAEWDRENTWAGPVPWKYKGYNAQLNSLQAEDGWRAIAQTTDGTYWVGSRDYGLWRLDGAHRSGGVYTRVTQLPSQAVLALAATDDGALYVGTDGQGLWRLEPGGAAPGRVEAVAGRRVLQLVYDPTVTPSMLFVLTDAGLTLLRGP